MGKISQSFNDAYNKADTTADIASATADTLCQAYNSDDGVDKDTAQMVLLGIIENIQTVKGCMKQMFDEFKKAKEEEAI